MSDHVRLCAVDDCANPHLARGLCRMHYGRVRRNGTTDLPTPTVEPCAVEGCDRTASRRGWCPAHYNRWKMWGDVRPEQPIRVRLDPVAQIMGKVKPSDGGCWLWTAHIGKNGYGYVDTGGRNRLAHRAAYETFAGPIPDGMTLDHLCRNKTCINPDHLEPVTLAENIRRAAAAKRSAA